jgi:lysophospholipase L1-like esterase
MADGAEAIIMASNASLKRTPYKNLCLLIATVLITLAMCELIARISASVREIGPTFSIYDSIYGKSLKKNFTATRITPEFIMRFTTNSFGFRGSEPEVFPYRSIFFLGDSFTMGYGVNDGEEFPALVEKNLAERYGKGKIPIVNAGIGNNGNGRWVNFLRAEGRKYNPCLIVLQIFNNDYQDNLDEHFFNLRSPGELEELPIRPQNKMRILQTMIEYIPGLSYSYFLGLVKQVLMSKAIEGGSLNKSDSPEYNSPSKDGLTLRLIQEILVICDDGRWPVLALVVDINGQRLADLEKIFWLHNVPIIKVPGKQERPDLYYQVDGHWTSAGHSFVAKLIVEQLFALKLINP